MISAEMKKRNGFLRRDTFALVASMSPGGEGHFQEEWSAFELAVRSFRDRHGKRAERIALTVVTDPANRSRAESLLVERTRASGFRTLVAGLAVDVRVDVAEEPPRAAAVGPTVRHVGIGVQHSLPIGWSAQVEEGGVSLAREGGGGEGCVIAGYVLDDGVEPAGWVRRNVVNKGFAVTDEDEAQAADGTELFTVVGRNEREGTWILAAAQRQPAVEWFVWVVVSGSELEVLEEAQEVIVGTMEWTDLAAAT